MKWWWGAIIFLVVLACAAARAPEWVAGLALIPVILAGVTIELLEERRV